MKRVIAILSALAVLGSFCLAGCSSEPEEVTTTTERNTTSAKSGTYSSSDYGSNTKSYSYSKSTEKSTYKQDDPYYRANDRDKDGVLSAEEFQGAVNDWMDDQQYGSYNGGGQTYKQDDPYYKANDYNNDGQLSGEEFRGAVNDWLDAYGY